MDRVLFMNMRAASKNTEVSFDPLSTYSISLKELQGKDSTENLPFIKSSIPCRLVM